MEGARETLCCYHRTLASIMLYVIEMFCYLHFAFLKAKSCSSPLLLAYRYRQYEGYTKESDLTYRYNEAKKGKTLRGGVNFFLKSRFALRK
jgi:hypothetical protein